MSAAYPEDLTLLDHLAVVTDNGPEPGVPDPPQEANWTPPATAGPAPAE